MTTILPCLKEHFVSIAKIPQRAPILTASLATIAALTAGIALSVLGVLGLVMSALGGGLLALGIGGSLILLRLKCQSQKEIQAPQQTALPVPVTFDYEEMVRQALERLEFHWQEPQREKRPHLSHPQKIAVKNGEKESNLSRPLVPHLARSVVEIEQEKIAAEKKLIQRSIMQQLRNHGVVSLSAFKEQHPNYVRISDERIRHALEDLVAKRKLQVSPNARYSAGDHAFSPSEQESSLVPVALWRRQVATRLSPTSY